MKSIWKVHDESAVHAVHDCFSREGTEAALLVDASNAFNSLNRNVALRNIRHVCPAISTILINTYRAPTDLFIDENACCPKREPLKGTHWPCLCLLWQPSH